MEERQNIQNDVRINTRISFYGPVIVVGSISFSAVGFLFFIIWLINYWSTAVLLSAWLIGIVLGLAGLALLIGLAALYVRLVKMPLIEASEKWERARGQAERNRILHFQENAIVFLDEAGSLIVRPLLEMGEQPHEEPLPAIEMEPLPEKGKANPYWTPEECVKHASANGFSLRQIAELEGMSVRQVRKILGA